MTDYQSTMPGVDDGVCTPPSSQETYQHRCSSGRAVEEGSADSWDWVEGCRYCASLIENRLTGKKWHRKGVRGLCRRSIAKEEDVDQFPIKPLPRQYYKTIIALSLTAFSLGEGCLGSEKGTYFLELLGNLKSSLHYLVSLQLSDMLHGLIIDTSVFFPRPALQTSLTPRLSPSCFL